MSETRTTIVRLLSNMASAKEIQQYLKRFSQLDAERFAVTPSASDYYAMSPADICILRLDTLEQLAGDGKPSVESGLHARMFKARPDCQASLHTHQPIASAFTLLAGVCLLLFTLWAAKFSSDRNWRQYEVIFAEPEAGDDDAAESLHHGRPQACFSWMYFTASSTVAMPSAASCGRQSIRRACTAP